MSRPSYVAAQLDIHDVDRYGRYVAGFAATLEAYGGQLLVADEQPVVLSGRWPHDKFVLIRFDSGAAAEAWLQSPEYAAIAGDREAAASTIAVQLAGIG